MYVEHPFQIPASIDNVPDDKMAVNAIASLHNLIRSLFVFDRSKIYWAYIMGVVGVVGLCELIGIGLLIGLIMKKKVNLLSWQTICKKGNLQMILPSLTSFTAFFMIFSGIWFMLFGVHRFRLNEELNPDELRSTLFWLCVVFVPFWLSLYVQAVGFLQFSVARNRKQSMQEKRTIWQTLMNIVIFSGITAFPIFVITSTIIPAYYVQQDYNALLPDILQYFVDSALTEEGYEYTNTSFNAIRVLRRYEDEALEIWKKEATIFSEAQPIFIMWSTYFGVLILMYVLGGSLMLLRKQKQGKVKPIVTVQPKIEESDEVEKIKINFTKPKIIITQPNSNQIKLHPSETSKHIVIAVGSTSVFIIVTFIAIKIVKLVETAEISNFICNLLGALSTIALATSLFTITHLSILYAMKNQSNSSLNKDGQHDGFSDIRSNDSDLTLV